MSTKKSAKQIFSQIETKLRKLLEIYEQNPKALKRVSGLIRKDSLRKIVKDWEKFLERVAKLEKQIEKADEKMANVLEDRRNEVEDSFRIVETLLAAEGIEV